MFTVLDDRGHPTPFPWFQPGVFTAPPHGLTRRQAREIEYRAVQRGSGRLILLALLISIPAFLVWSLAIPFLVAALGWGAFALGVPLGAAGPLVFCIVARYLMRRRLARAYVDHGRCGSCFYPLSGIEAGPDGLVACPECGAAWSITVKLTV